MTTALNAGPAPADSTKYQRNVAAIKQAMAGKPQPEIDAEVERYLRSEGGTPAGESDPLASQRGSDGSQVDKFKQAMSGPWDVKRGLTAAAHVAGSGLEGAVQGATAGLVHGPEITDPDPTLQQDMHTAKMAGNVVGGSALGLGLGKVALGGTRAVAASPVMSKLAQVLFHGHGGGALGAYEGYKHGGIPGGVLGYLVGGKLGGRLGGGAEGGAEAAAVRTPPQLVGPDEISQSAVSSPAFTKALNGGFAKSGYDAARVASGNDAMAQGISNLTPQAPNPMSMEEAFNAAGQAGAPASAGNAAMAKGIANIKPGKMPLDKAMGVLSKGMPGAGKFGGGAGAAVGMALNGPQSPLQGGMAPVPPPLSTNLPEAKEAGLSALEAGQPRNAVAEMLGLKYDPATVKFVLAGLPNRVPQ